MTNDQALMSNETFVTRQKFFGGFKWVNADLQAVTTGYKGINPETRVLDEWLCARTRGARLGLPTPDAVPSARREAHLSATLKKAFLCFIAAIRSCLGN
jgi:hypothetical protein